jgi:hypothetical protein
MNIIRPDFSIREGTKELKKVPGSGLIPKFGFDIRLYKIYNKKFTKVK